MLNMIVTKEINSQLRGISHILEVNWSSRILENNRRYHV